MRLLTVGAVLFALSAALSGCSTDTREKRAGDTLVVAAPSELQPLNPLLATEANTSQLILHALYVPLVRLDEQLNYIPGAAESWDFAGDTALLLRLRRDVRWHDGTPTTAHDVVFTFERIRDEETGFAYPYHFEGWSHAEAVDSFTVRLRGNAPNDPLLGWALTPVVPKHLLDSIPASRMREAAFGSRPVGNGPFRFVSHQTNSQWVFEANPDFPAGLGGPPALNRLIWRIISDNFAQVAELEAGTVHVALSVRAEQAKQFDARPEFNAVIAPSARYIMIGWNGKRPELRDARVRRALAHAIDRQEILDVLRGGYGQLAASPIGPFHAMYDSSVTTLGFDPEKAKQLLAEAGLRDRDGDGVVEGKNGRRWNLELKVPAGNKFNADVAEMIRADLQAIGVRMSTRPVEFATLVEDISTTARRFDAVLMGFEADLHPDLRETFHSRYIDGPMQLASYSNAQLDALLDSIATTRDVSVQQVLWSSTQTILRDDQPLTILWFSPQILVARDEVKNFAPDIRGLLVNVRQWTLQSNSRTAAESR